MARFRNSRNSTRAFHTPAFNRFFDVHFECVQLEVLQTGSVAFRVMQRNGADPLSFEDATLSRRSFRLVCVGTCSP